MVPMTIRRQATLYVPSPESTWIEALRCEFNPCQHQLIRAHATLCREDEVSDWNEFESRLRLFDAIAIQQEFGNPIRDGNLVYIPAVGQTDSFDAMRSALLANGKSEPRKHFPHITLIHPRNGICTDAIFSAIMQRCSPFTLTIRCVTLIQQSNGDAWQDLVTIASH